jgi:hypothetical protein
MAKNEIAEKLTRFLAAHDPITEECHAVYLMVELRKLLDQRGSQKSYPLVKFYSDWTVHYQKDRSIGEIEPIANAMYAAAEKEILAGRCSSNIGLRVFGDFAKMSDLRGTMTEFLRAEGIGTSIVDDNAKWAAFVSQLIEVLAHQPLIIKSATVKGIQFSPKNKSFVMSLNRPVAGRSHFRSGRS